MNMFRIICFMKYVQDDRKLVLNCKMIFIAVTTPGRSFQILVLPTLKLDGALSFTCSTGSFLLLLIFILLADLS